MVGVQMRSLMSSCSYRQSNITWTFLSDILYIRTQDGLSTGHLLREDEPLAFGQRCRMLPSLQRYREHQQ